MGDPSHNINEKMVSSQSSVPSVPNVPVNRSPSANASLDYLASSSASHQHLQICRDG